MGMLAISMADTELIKHLKAGGRIEDQAAFPHVLTIVQNTFENEKAGGAARRMGFDVKYLAALYVAVTKALMPEPIIQHGKPIIVTSLVFQDFDRFEAFLQMITNFGSLTPENAFKEIQVRAVELVIEMKVKAVDIGKGRELAESRTGCALLLLGGIILYFAA